MARLDFANARIGARRSRLLGGAGLRELLARPTLEARIEHLRATPLGAALPTSAGAAQADAALGAVEGALREALRREQAQVLGDVEGRRPRELLAAVLGLEEAAAVKAVVRGVAHGATANRILAAALPAPALDAVRLREAASATSVEAALAALAADGSPVALAAGSALALRARYGLLPLEIAADRAAFARAAAAARGYGEDAAIVRAHVEDRVDARNAATLLALAGTPPASEAFVAGGRRLEAESFQRLIGAEVATLHARLAGLFRWDAAGLARPWSLDRALERALLAPLRRAARARPLSIAVPLAYLLERRAEVRRVALLLRGAALGLPGDELLDLVEA